MSLLPTPRALWISCFLVAALSFPGSASAQRLFFPLEFGQGAIFVDDSPTLYGASARLQGALGLGRGERLRVGPTVALLYLNPEWAGAGGLGASMQLFGLRSAILQQWGVYLSAEQLWGGAEARPLSLGLVGDLGFFRIAGRGVRDWARDRTGFEFSLGTGLESLVPILSGGGRPDPSFP